MCCTGIKPVTSELIAMTQTTVSLFRRCAFFRIEYHGLRLQIWLLKSELTPISTDKLHELTNRLNCYISLFNFFHRFWTISCLFILFLPFQICYFVWLKSTSRIFLYLLRMYVFIIVSWQKIVLLYSKTNNKIWNSIGLTTVPY